MKTSWCTAVMVLAFSYDGSLYAQEPPFCQDSSFFNSYIFNVSNIYWPSDTCPTGASFVLPANVMCPDNEPNCYEPSSRWDVGIAVLNGPLKAAKALYKYRKDNQAAAMSGVFNALADSVLIGLKGEATLQEAVIFTTRLAREYLRATDSAGPTSRGSYDDLPNADETPNQAKFLKAVLKVPLIIEKNLDWGDNSTSTTAWLASSAPAMSLSLLEHYARYFRLFTLRPATGLALTAIETVSYCSMCTQAPDSEEEIYKSIRQGMRVGLHWLQYLALWRDREEPSSLKFRRFTYLTMLEHFLVSAADLGYYYWYLRPKPTA